MRGHSASKTRVNALVIGQIRAGKLRVLTVTTPTRCELLPSHLGMMMFRGSPAKLGIFIVEETEKWARVVKFAGIKAEIDYQLVFGRHLHCEVGWLLALEAAGLGMKSQDGLIAIRIIGAVGFRLSCR